MTVAIPRSVIDTVLSRAFDDKPAEEILRWGLDTFAPRIALSASFGSPEGMVLLDMMHNIDPAKTRVFTIDTGRLHQETYDLMDRVRTRYEVEVEVYFPKPEAVQAMVREHGLNLFYDSADLRKKCCGVRKVEPLERALADLDAWIAGLRPEQFIRAVQQNEFAQALRITVQDVANVRRQVHVLVQAAIDDADKTEVTEVATRTSATLHLVEA